MKRMLVGALALIVVAGQAAASDRDRVMEKLADMIAINALCPKWVADEKLLTLAITVFSIDLDDGSSDAEALMRMSREKVALMKGQSSGKEEEVACLAAQMLYGPNGTNGAGMMRKQ